MKKSPIIRKICSIHGMTFHMISTNGRIRCKKCRTEQVTKTRQNNKLKLVKKFGGKCKLCGYSKCINALVFHHKDPTKKKFSISSDIRSYVKLSKEAEKCILICANCHAELHEIK